MEFRHLNCFIKVSEYLSFTEAAEELHLVQSAVSHNIAELEKDLNVKLFYRNKQTINLTPAGKMLLRDAYKIVAAGRDAQTKAHCLATGIRGNVTVCYVLPPVATCMFDKFKKFAENYPDVRVKYNSFNDRKILKFLENYEVDIGFTRQATITNQERIAWFPIYKESLKVVVSKDHVFSGRKTIDLSQLKDETLILMSHRVDPGLYDMSMHLFLTRGCAPRIIDNINDQCTVNMLVEIGMGFTILPTCCKSFVNPSLRFIDIEGDDASHFMGIAWNKTNPNPCTKLFLTEMGINSYAKEMQDVISIEAGGRVMPR